MVGVFEAVGNGVRVLVGRPKLKSIEDAATLLRNVAPVAVKPVARVESNSICDTVVTETGTATRHVVK